MRYQGLHDCDGVCHVRVFERAGALPVVIAGELEDNPGTSVTNAIEMVAAAVSRDILTDGREFKLIEHYLDSLDDAGNLAYSWVHFKHRQTHESPDDAAHNAGTVVIVEGAHSAASTTRIEGDFRDPSWEPIADIERELGCPIAIWAAARYTALAVAGNEGKRLRDQIAEYCQIANQRLLDVIEPRDER